MRPYVLPSPAASQEPFCMLPLLPLCRTIVNDTNMAMAMEPYI